MEINQEYLTISPGYLIKVMEKSFTSLSIIYRIEAFKTIARAQGNENFSIEGLAYESGFNSKTLFNTQAVP